MGRCINPKKIVLRWLFFPLERRSEENAAKESVADGGASVERPPSVQGGKEKEGHP